MKICIVFDGPPSHESGRFVEVEDEHGSGMRVGEWRERPDGLWSLDIEVPFLIGRGHLDDEARELVAKTIHREGEDDWEEWAVHTEDERERPPRMLAVRIDNLIQIVEGPATTRSSTARIKREDNVLPLTYDLAVWLLSVLPRALEKKYGGDGAEAG